MVNTGGPLPRQCSPKALAAGPERTGGPTGISTAAAVEQGARYHPAPLCIVCQPSAPAPRAPGSAPPAPRPHPAPPRFRAAGPPAAPRAPGSTPPAPRPHPAPPGSAPPAPRLPGARRPALAFLGSPSRRLRSRDRQAAGPGSQDCSARRGAPEPPRRVLMVPHVEPPPEGRWAVRATQPRQVTALCACPSPGFGLWARGGASGGTTWETSGTDGRSSSAWSLPATLTRGRHVVGRRPVAGGGQATASSLLR